MNAISTPNDQRGFKRGANRIAAMAIVISALSVQSCGGGGDAPKQVNIDYSAIRLLSMTDAPLVASADQTLESLLKNGVRLSSSSGVAFAAGSASAAPAPPAAPTFSFSDTTVQVDGVDEGDLVKYDGRNIFSLHSEPEYPWSVPQVPGGAVGTSIAVPTFMYKTKLMVTRTNAVNASTQLLSTTVLPGRQRNYPSMYKVEEGATDHLAIVSQLDTGSASYWEFWNNQRIAVDILDVRDAAAPTTAWRIEIPGVLRQTRKIGDVLYLVAHYTPSIVGINRSPNTIEERESNERLILGARLADLLPQYRVDGLDAPLLADGKCLLPPSTEKTHAYLDLIWIAAIDLRARRVLDAACLNSHSNAVYVSEDSLYVGANSYATATSAPVSVLHKFKLGAGRVEYRAAGSAKGSIGWSNPSYYMDEHGGDLRIVTSEFTNGDNVHRLSVLRESGGQRMTAVAELPNAARPEPIGKPRETVRSVRFFEDRAYVVTFRNTDPLYAIDLSNPADPRIAGELEIPGFATYLRPLGVGIVDRNYLFSVGYQADSTGLQEGVKVELYDVSDIRLPRSVGVDVIGRRGTRALATVDPHELTFVTLPGVHSRYRMAFSVDVSDTPIGSSSQYYDWTHTALYLYEADGIESGMPRLRRQGKLIAESRSTTKTAPAFSGPHRSVLHDESVFYIHGDKILSSLWSNAEL